MKSVILAIACCLAVFMLMFIVIHVLLHITNRHNSHQQSLFKSVYLHLDDLQEWFTLNEMTQGEARAFKEIYNLLVYLETGQTCKNKNKKK